MSLAKMRSQSGFGIGKASPHESDNTSMLYFNIPNPQNSINNKKWKKKYIFFVIIARNKRGNGLCHSHTMCMK